MSRDSDWFWSVEHQDYYKAVYNADGSLVRYVWARETTNPTPQVTTQEIESAWAWSQDHRDWYKAVYDADGSVARYTWGRDSTAPTTQSAPQYSSPTPTSGSAQYSSPPPTYTPDAPRPEHPSRSYSAPANTSQSNRQDIDIAVHHASTPVRAVAVFDTGSDQHNWISQNLLGRLRIQPIQTTPVAVSSADGPINSSQMVQISFKLPGGSRYNDCQCYVLPRNDPGHADVILGHSYLKEKGILQDFNLSNLYPLLSYGGPSQST
ncbi:hypothetical protein DPSP01_004447 [Paraphaeosphaeria sporulosa]